MADLNWRDMFMALVNRTASGQLSVTQEELDKADKTGNSMVVDNGKITIFAEGRWPDEKRIDEIGQNGEEEHF